MKYNDIIKTIDSASVLVKFGLIRIKYVYADSQLMTNDEEFARASKTLSDAAEEVRYDKDYKGIGPAEIEKQLNYSDLQRINMILINAYEPANLTLLRSYLTRQPNVTARESESIADLLKCDIEDLGIFKLINPKDSKLKNGNPGIVVIDKRFWQKICEIARQYKDSSSNSHTANRASNAWNLMKFVKSAVEKQYAQLA
jgi:hypothetical protein